MAKKIFEEKSGIYSGLNEFFLKECGFSGKKILDVGCNTGLLGSELKKKQNMVFGIDISEKAIAQAAKKLDKAIAGNAEDVQRIFKGEKFDIILFEDVLEHTMSPKAILENSKNLLTEGGFIIVSVPNIANWKIRLKLLFGKFDYEKAGILDETHIHFFNFKNAKKMIEESGYSIFSEKATPGFHIPLLNRLKVFQKLNYWISNFYKPLFAMQFIFKAKKR